MTTKQDIFITEYLKCWNATEAAREAGYSHPRRQGSRLLSNVDISAKIKAELAARRMSADEVLDGLTELARGTILDFLDFGDGSLKKPIIDLRKAKELNRLGLIKKLKYNPKGGLEIELYSRDRALELMGKHHGVLNDKLELTVTAEMERIITALIENLEGEALEKALAAIEALR
jgi:phage terminase small subunit